MTSLTPHSRAILILFVAAILFSLGGVFIKLSDWQALPLNAIRSAVSAGVMGVYLRATRTGPRPTYTRNMVLGAIAYTATNLTFMQATKLTTAANAIFLQFTAPVWIILISYFFLAEKPNRADWGATALILPGMALFFADQLSPEGLSGNFIAIISGVTLAFMVILLRQEKAASIDIVILGSIMAFVIGLPWIFSQPWDWANILLILGLGIFQLGISFILYGIAIKHLSAMETIVILTLEPILNPIWVALFAGETPGFWAILGSLIVVVGIVGRVWFSIKEASATFD